MRSDTALARDATQSELTRLEPVLRTLGLQTPLRHARDLLAAEHDWTSALTQSLWRERIGYWRQVLPDGEDGTQWGDLLDLGRPRLRSRRRSFLRADTADAAWADYMRERRLLAPFLADPRLRRLLYDLEGWDAYNPDGALRLEPVEGFLRGQVRLVSLEPVSVDMDVTEPHRAARTRFAEGTNAVLLVGVDGWTPRVGAASRWLRYGGKPVPTTLVHYEAGADVATKGFAALVLPFDQSQAESAQAVELRVERDGEGTPVLKLVLDGRPYSLAPLRASGEGR